MSATLLSLRREIKTEMKARIDLAYMLKAMSLPSGSHLGRGIMLVLGKFGPMGLPDSAEEMRIGLEE